MNLTPFFLFAWSALQMGAVLGQGASGVIHAALAQQSGDAGPTALAVKVFKGEVTSDGWPHSEWAASLAAGAHPQLIAASGRLTGHPQGAEGLVTPRVPASFAALAGPPSHSSCTRDVYSPGTRMSAEVLLQMARGVADAARHLHRRGLMHGDLYAHNLLWDGRGAVWLGDFGAASLLPADLDRVQRRAFERLEVLAFGLLLQEWLARCDDAPASLLRLQADCVQAQPHDRPLFDQVLASLGQA